MSSDSERRRLLRIALALVIAFGVVIAVGLTVGRKPARDPNQPGAYTDEEWARVTEYQSLPEKQEIDRFQAQAIARIRAKEQSVYDDPSFDRILDLTRHPKVTVRGGAIYLLGMTSQAVRPPWSNIPEAANQWARAKTRLYECVGDSDARVRSRALYSLAACKDDHFVEVARRDLASDDPNVRQCAQVYLDAAAKAGHK